MTGSPYDDFGASAGGGPVAQIIEAMPAEDYDALPYLRNSDLHHMARSGAHFYEHRENPTQTETPALSFGTLAHCGVLEPDAIEERYQRIPAYELEIDAKSPKLTKAYREQVAAFREAVAPKTAVPIADYDRMVGVAKSVKDCADVFRDGRAETVLVWQDSETSIWCKARLDYLKFHGDTGTIYDLKTSRDCLDFGRSIGRYGYDRQAAFYLRGCRALGLEVQSFWFVVVEPHPPFGCMAAPLDPVTLADGEAQVKDLLARVAKCEALGEWEGYEHPETWRKPDYQMKYKPREKVQVTVGGHTVAV